MNETSFEAKVMEGVTLMTHEQAWNVLNAMCDALTKPGWLEHQLEHSPLAGKMKAAKLNLFNALVTGSSICQGLTDQAADTMSKSIHELQVSYISYLQMMLDQTSMAIQSLPFSELMAEAKLAEGDFDVDSLGIEDSGLASVRAQQEAYKNTGMEGKALLAKPCEQVQIMFSVAAAMLGGVEKLAAIQAEIVQTLPEQYRKNPIVVLAAQATGAVSRALQDRASRDDFTTGTIAAVSELYLTFERAATLPFIPMWDEGAGDVFGRVLDESDSRVNEMLQSDAAGPLTDADRERAAFSREAEQSAEAFVQKAEQTNLKPQSKPLEADKPDNMKATSTLFTGTRTIN